LLFLFFILNPLFYYKGNKIKKEKKKKIESIKDSYC